MARVTGSRPGAASKARARTDGGVGLGGMAGGGPAEVVEEVVGVERGAGGLVEHRDPAEVAGFGPLADPFEHPADLAEPGLGLHRGRQGPRDRAAEEPSRGVGQAVEPGGQGDRPIAVVAGEKLVPGVAGQGRR